MNYPSNAIFSDKATIILRELLATSNTKWTMRALAVRSKTSIGLVSRTVSILNQLGCLVHGGLGRNGYFQMTQPDEVVEQWVQYYDFSFNRVKSFYIPNPNVSIMRDITFYLKRHGIRHALTLHSGANLITNFFSYDQYHIYVDDDDISRIAIDISAKIDINRLASGGNIHFVRPYYRNAVFDRSREIKGLPVVSNLQLYLDLFRFIPRGNEHAEMLRNTVKSKFYE